MLFVGIGFVCCEVFVFVLVLIVVGVEVGWVVVMIFVGYFDGNCNDEERMKGLL